MCTRYISPEQREIEAFWKIDRRSNQRKDWKNLLTVFPLSLGAAMSARISLRLATGATSAGI